MLIKRPFKILLAIVIAIVSYPLNHAIALQGTAQYNIYISPKGDDAAKGSIDNPFKTINRAKQEVGVIKAKITGNGSINVWLRKGTYVIASTVVFTPKDGGTDKIKVAYKAYPTENVILSGGYQLGRGWVQQANGLWSIKLPDFYKTQMPRQLFANGARLQRSTSPFLRTTGMLAQYKPAMKQYKGNWTYLRQNYLGMYCTFSYSDADLEGIDSSENPELIVYHSWECAWQRFDHIDKKIKAVYLKSPSLYPVGHFSNQLFYRVENTMKYLKTPGQWLYKPTTNEIYYLPKPGEDVNSLKFVVPSLAKLMEVTNRTDSDNYVTNLTFDHITFKYNSYPMVDFRSINTSTIGGLKKQYPYLELNTGFASSQGATTSGSAVTLYGANNCEFTNCEFSDLGNYALDIGMYCSYNKVKNCTFSDLGAGGIMIGIHESSFAAINPKSVGSNNLVDSCKIHDIGLIHPSGIGIMVMQSHDNTLSNNEVYNTPYSGISVGWTWGNLKNYTYNNLIVANKVYNAMQLLTDGGGIYTIGPQKGTLIKDNIVHDIRYTKQSPVEYDYNYGSNRTLSNAIFFDNSSAGIKLDGNSIYNVGTNKPLRFNTDSTLMIWGRNSIRK